MFRNIALLFSVLLISMASLPAQINFPALSPKTNVTQIVGNTMIKIEYNRPVARGRDIFGGLVPYDKPWITSGGEGVLISFDEPVTIDEQLLPAGLYALITIPGEKEWTIIIHDGNHGIMRYEKSEIRVQTCVPVKKSGRYYEALSLELDVTPNNAQLYISWTDVQVSFPIKTSIDREIMTYIDSLMVAPLADDGDPYFRSAQYLLFNQQEQEKAIMLIQRLQELDDGEYPYRLLIRAYIQLGQKENALKAIDDGLPVMKREYADQPDRISSFIDSYEKQRAMILAGTANGQRAW